MALVGFKLVIATAGRQVFVSFWFIWTYDLVDWVTDLWYSIKWRWAGAETRIFIKIPDTVCSWIYRWIRLCPEFYWGPCCHGVFWSPAWNSGLCYDCDAFDSYIFSIRRRNMLSNVTEQHKMEWTQYIQLMLLHSIQSTAHLLLVVLMEWLMYLLLLLSILIFHLITKIWDGAAKKRLCQFHKYPTSIAALAFDSVGQQLAIAASYTFEEGEKDHPADSILIRRVTDVEVKPKPKV